jgi:hypothetical protein
MSRCRRELTRPEIARLADETSELRRELQDLVRGRRKPARGSEFDLSQTSRNSDGKNVPPVTAPMRRSARKRR